MKSYPLSYLRELFSSYPKRHFFSPPKTYVWFWVVIAPGASDICALETVRNGSSFLQYYLQAGLRKFIKKKSCHVWKCSDQNFEAEYDLISKFALSKVDSWFLSIKSNTLNAACLIYWFLLWFVYNAVVYILIAADILNLGKQLQKNLVTFL